MLASPWLSTVTCTLKLFRLPASGGAVTLVARMSGRFVPSIFATRTFHHAPVGIGLTVSSWER